MSRTVRYSSLLPVEAFPDYHIVVVGCGSIGRRVALDLCSMGFTSFTLVDPDTVSEENLGPQGWALDEITWPKVEALQTTMFRHADHAALHAWLRPQMFNPDHLTIPTDRLDSEHQPTKLVVFACVDSMKARRQIAVALNNLDHDNWTMYDARMAAEFFEAHTATPATIHTYIRNLYDDGTAYQAPCTERSTIYCASMAASFLIGQFTRHLRGLPLIPATQYSILDCFMSPLPLESPMENNR